MVFDNFQVRRENHAGITTIGRVEDGVDELAVAGETLGGVSGFHAIIQRHCGDGATVFQIEHRDVVETVWFGISWTCSDVEDAVVDGRAAAA